jgi:hypothetical protein
MKQIDLSCKVIGPALAGLLMPLLISSKSSSSQTTTWGLEWGCLFVGLLNTLALIAEYICTARIYTLIPSLADKRPQEHRKGNIADASTADEEISWFESCTSSELRLYMQQPVALQGLSLALVYSNG